MVVKGLEMPGKTLVQLSQELIWMVRMWSLVFLLQACLNPVESQAENNRLILEGGSNPCEGYIQVYHGGTWGYIGTGKLSSENKKVVCKSTMCGELVNTTYMSMPRNSPKWLLDLQCSGSEDYLWNCPFIKWDASDYRSEVMEKIQCSHKIKIELEFSCGGLVTYSDGQTSGYMCGNDWGEKEGTVVCRSFKCGKLKEIPKWTHSGTNIKNIMSSCLGNETHLWECAPREEKSCNKLAEVYCEGHKILRLKGNTSNVCSGTLEMKQNEAWKSKDENNVTTLDRWCRQMYCGSYVSHESTVSDTQLTCSDKVRVVLQVNGQPSKCYGTVHIEVNGTALPVCGSSAVKDYKPEVICRELGCGKVIQNVIQDLGTEAKMDLVSCADEDLSLWHCKAKRSHKPFECTKQIYLICSDSANVRLKDGPGKCAGRLEIFYEGQWQKVYKTRWNERNSNAVCRHLGCGEAETSQDVETFTNGPSNFLNKNINCQDNSQGIFDCSFGDSTTIEKNDKETVSITCKEHKDLFLSAGFCHGNVGIQFSGQTFWLSADGWNQTFADIVCGQMHCGTAKTVEVTPFKDSFKNTWNTSDCRNVTSVFDYTLNFYVNNTEDIKIAHVNCTGTKTINLTNTCWGFVNICEEEKCGGLCDESWTEEKSRLLCKKLGCGDHFFKSNARDFNVKFKHVYLPKEMNDLTMSHIVKCDKNDNSCSRNGAFVICSGSLKPRFDQSKDYCSGNVQLYQEDKWLPVCEDVLSDDNTKNLICAQLNCGSADKSIDHYGSIETNEYVTKLKCPQNSTSFHSCRPSANVKSCTPRGLQCSEWKQMVLVNGDNACSGVLLVYSKQNHRAAVSSEGWTDKEIGRLCEDQSCGTKGTIEDQGKLHITDVPFWKERFNCTGVEKPQSIWDCKKNDLTTKNNRQLYIRCNESPTVNLTQGCHGEVLINDVEVCSTGWDPSYSKLVCQEKKCGFAVERDLNQINEIPIKPQSLDKTFQHVSCEKYHTKLGQCRRFKGKCDKNPVTVFCSGSVKVNTTDKCGGEILVNFQDEIDKKKMEKVCFEGDLSFKIKENLCSELKCGGPENNPKTDSNSNKISKMDMNATLTCANDDTHNIKYCVSKTKCKGKPARIFCGGYVPPIIYVEPQKELKKSPEPVLPIVLSLGLFLILAIGVFIFLRFYLIRKNKSIKDILPRFSKKKEEEIESGDYEDMPSLEMEDINSHGAEKDGSASSLAYDDVDEICETQPLTSEDPKQTQDDEVDYEVEDPLDSYDDIDASPEIVQTAAEVHPRPSSVDDTGEAPPDLVLGDDDYLVPVENV